MPGTSTTLPAQQKKPSQAIQSAADLFIELIKSEKAKVTQLYHLTLKNLEDHKSKAEADLGTEKMRNAQYLRRIEALSAELEQMHQKEQSAQVELSTLRWQHDTLKEAVCSAGMIYVGHTIQFNQDTSRIVDDFIAVARKQNIALTAMGSPYHAPTMDDALSASNLGPAGFFAFVAGVLEKGRWLAQDIWRRQQGHNEQQESSMSPMPGLGPSDSGAFVAQPGVATCA